MFLPLLLQPSIVKPQRSAAFSISDSTGTRAVSDPVYFHRCLRTKPGSRATVGGTIKDDSLPGHTLTPSKTGFEPFFKNRSEKKSRYLRPMDTKINYNPRESNNRNPLESMPCTRPKGNCRVHGADKPFFTVWIIIIPKKPRGWLDIPHCNMNEVPELLRGSGIESVGTRRGSRLGIHPSRTRAILHLLSMFFFS